MKRLLVCIYTHNTWGGIESWLSSVVDHLGAHGWDVVVGLARGRMHNDPATFRRIHPDFNCIELDGRSGTPAGRALAVARGIRRVRPAVVMPLGLADVYAAVAMLKAARHDIRLAIAVHATNLALFEDLRRYEPVVDLCLGVNPLHLLFLESWAAYAPARVGVILNGVRLPEPDRRPALRPPGPLRIAFVGRLDPITKGVLDAVPLVRELERRGVDYRLSFVGDGEAGDTLRAQLAASVAAGRVEFHGYLDPERVQKEMYPRQDALIMFSRQEACPLVLQEAMAHGVVPVCTDFIGIRSLGFVREGINSLVYPPGDVSRAVDHLQALAGDRPGLLTMAQSCRATSRYFPLQKMLQEWLEALDRLARQPPRPLADHARDLALPSEADSGRLGRIGLSPAWADRVRRFLLPPPRLVDGWAEWPGTYAHVDERTRRAMLERLASLDRAGGTSR